MSLFKTPRGGSPESPESPEPSDNAIPVAAVDLSKRYDLYCSMPDNEDRLYEDMRIIGIRTFQQKTQFSSGLIGGYLEIEARDGTRVMITHHFVRMFCEHGTKPIYKVLK